MVRYCNVASCVHWGGCSDKSIKFFRIPTDPQMAMKWKITVWGADKPGHLYVCQLHFAAKDLTNRGKSLKPGTMPSLLLPTDPSARDIEDDPIEQDDHNEENGENIEFTKIEPKFDTTEIKYELDMEPELADTHIGFRCIQQDSQCQAAIQKLAEKCDSLAAEVRMLRQWAAMQNLSPPSLPATPTRIEDEQADLPIDSDFTCGVDVNEEPNQEIKSEEDETNIIDDMKTDENISGKLDDPLKMGKPIKEEANHTIDGGSTSGGDTTIIHNGTVLTLKLFKCRECDKQFNLPTKLRMHMAMVHTNKTKPSPSPSPPLQTPAPRKPRTRPNRTLMKDINEFECYLCKKRSKNGCLARTHMSKQHTKPRFKRCLICNELSTTIESEHSCAGLKLDCEYCSKRFDSLHRLNAHLRDDHLEKLLYGCNICNRTFEMRSLMEHHKSKHLPGCFACKKCPEKFDETKQLRQHIVDSHMEEPANLCDICGKSFQTKYYLAVHKRSHGNPEFKCKKCPYTSYAYHYLRKHTKRHHSNQASLYSCIVCNKRFKDLKKHALTHTYTEADRTHACNLCPAKFHDAHRLQGHVRAIHKNGGRSFSCSYCDKAYKHSGDLNKHLRSHLGDKMYKCSDCPEAFRMPLELKKHSYIHYREEDGAHVNS